MASSVLERLLLRIEADTGALKRELRVAGDSTERAGTRMSRAFQGASRAADQYARNVLSLRTAIGAVAGASGLGYMVKRMVEAAEQLQDVADRTDFGVERLQALQFAFDKNGVTIEETNAGLRRFTRRVGLAADKMRGFSQEGGAAYQAIRTYNIEILDAQNNVRSAEAVFNDAVRVIASLETQAERAALASRLFGEDAGPAMAVLLSKGSQAIQSYERDLRQMGGVLSADVVRQAADASAELRALGQVVRANFTRGVLEGFTGEFGELSELMRDSSFQEGVRSISETIGELLRIVAENQDEVLRVAAAFGAMAATPAPPWIKLLVGGGVYAMSDFRSEVEATRDRIRSLTDDIERFQKMQSGALPTPPGFEVDKAIEAKRRALQQAKEDLKELQMLERQAARSPDPLGRLNTPSQQTSPGSGGDDGPPKRDIGPLRDRVGKLAEELRQERKQTEDFLDGVTDAYLRATDQQIALIERRRDAQLEALEELTASEAEKAQARREINATAEAQITEIRRQEHQRRYAIAAELQRQERERWNQLGETIDDTLLTSLQRVAEGYENWRKIAVRAIFDVIRATIELNKQQTGGSGGSIGGLIVSGIQALTMAGGAAASSMSAGAQGNLASYQAKAPGATVGGIGFDTGGSGRVAGTGGPDSKSVSLRLTPGELVNVTRPDQAMQGGRIGNPIQVNNYNDFRGADASALPRIRQMLEQNKEETVAEVFQQINEGGEAARAVGRLGRR